MMKPITKNQQRCLDKLDYKWRSAYELNENLNTLNSLHKRGIVVCNALQGSYFFPRTNIVWKLKNQWIKPKGE